jgi:hypothetical protein
MGIQIKTSGSKAGAANGFSSEISNSPATKTPTLVARIGLVYNFYKGKIYIYIYMNFGSKSNPIL